MRPQWNMLAVFLGTLFLIIGCTGQAPDPTPEPKPQEQSSKESMEEPKGTIYIGGFDKEDRRDFQNPVATTPAKEQFIAQVKKKTQLQYDNAEDHIGLHAELDHAIALNDLVMKVFKKTDVDTTELVSELSGSKIIDQFSLDPEEKIEQITAGLYYPNSSAPGTYEVQILEKNQPLVWSNFYLVRGLLEHGDPNTKVPDYTKISIMKNQIHLTLPTRLVFDQGKTSLKDSAKDTLNQVIQYIQKHPSKQVEIHGYTDPSAVDQTEEQAEAVKEYLENSLSSDHPQSPQLISYGNGGATPLNPDDPTENQRIMIIIHRK